MPISDETLNQVRFLAQQAGWAGGMSHDKPNPRNFYEDARKRVENTPPFSAESPGTLSNVPVHPAVPQANIYTVTDLLSAAPAGSIVSLVTARTGSFIADHEDPKETEKNIYLNIPVEKLRLLESRCQEMAQRSGITGKISVAISTESNIYAQSFTAISGAKGRLGTNEVHISAPMLASLDMDELTGVMAHEVGHIMHQHQKRYEAHDKELSRKPSEFQLGMHYQEELSMHRYAEFESDAHAITLGYGKHLEKALCRLAAQNLGYKNSCEDGVRQDLQANIGEDHPAMIQRLARLTALGEAKETGAAIKHDTKNPDLCLPKYAPVSLPGHREMKRRAQHLSEIIGR